MSTSHHPSDAARLPISTCVIVYAALMFFLIATYGLDHISMGRWNLILAMTIAVVKSAMVVWYFMEARYSSRLTLLAFFAGVVMISIGFIMMMADYVTRT